MKKASKDLRIDDLKIDVIEYMFTEWLVRRGIFTAYKSNYEHAFSPCESFRDRLRNHIRRSLSGFNYSPIHLISTAFVFTSTPEGVKFWSNHSFAWQRFYAEFQSNL